MKIKSALATIALLASSALGATRVSFDASNNTVIDGKTIFPISLAILPPADAKSPQGKSAWDEFADGGVNLVRVTPHSEGNAAWDAEGYQTATEYMNHLAPANLYVWMTLRPELSFVDPGEEKKLEKLKKVIETYKDHPALMGWKAADEPLWGNMNTHGKRPPSSLALTYQTIHELDPNHPVIVLQAPRGTADENAAYDPYLDVTGMDVFPIGYPPGGHVPTWPNKEISMVGDWTKIIVDAARGKPVWMTLQITFSGVTPTEKQPNRIIRFPTFEQERFMTYEAIINGARGINYFGGAAPTTLNERDAKLGFNWTFWNRILKPLLAEINEKSPLHAALLAPNSTLPVKVDGKGIEYVVREVGSDVYILACKREGDTIQVHFTGLPGTSTSGEVLFEEPRKVSAKDGSFTDWFAPFDVHVYKFHK